jgi:hypothetical protein
MSCGSQIKTETFTRLSQKSPCHKGFTESPYPIQEPHDGETDG